MAAEIVRLLHSGFVSYELSSLEQLRQDNMTTYQRLTDDRVFSKNYKDYYDVEVDRLTKRYFNDPALIKSASFREEVLVKAKQLFFESDISFWFQMQMKFSTVTHTHRRYLQETVDYVTIGKPRTMSNTNYRRILTGNIAGFDRVQQDADKMFNRGEFMGSETSDWIKGCETVTFLRYWTDCLDGVADLLEWLNVVYGPRHDQYS